MHGLCGGVQGVVVFCLYVVVCVCLTMDVVLLACGCGGCCGLFGAVGNDLWWCFLFRGGWVRHIRAGCGCCLVLLLVVCLVDVLCVVFVCSFLDCLVVDGCCLLFKDQIALGALVHFKVFRGVLSWLYFHFSVVVFFNWCFVGWWGVVLSCLLYSVLVGCIGWCFMICCNV